MVHRATGRSQQGWDWFSVQLDNGAELMLFDLRRTDGGIDPIPPARSSRATAARRT